MHNRSRFLKSSAAKATTRKRNVTISASARKYNFSAGPAMLPLDVLEEAQEDLEVKYNSESMEIGFNVSYLLDVLNVLNHESLKMTLINSNSSVLIESLKDSHSLYVVMPMRL